MKKYIIIILLVWFIFTGISYSQFGGGTVCSDSSACTPPQICEKPTIVSVEWVCVDPPNPWWWNCVVLTFSNWSSSNYCWPSECQSAYQDRWNDPQNNTLLQAHTNCIAQYGPNNNWNNPPATWWTSWNSWSTCTWWAIVNWQCVVNNAWTLWINMDSRCLINWQCSLDIYDTLWIRQSLPKSTRSSPWIFIQDIILSATFFVGTLITWVLVISWLLFVFAWANGNLAAKAKKWITGSLIWLLFVTWSYAFVRLIQFLVTWGGG
jgi:hypothetical protein